jgi:glycosyltransferase involved in cell wall biosynthesis
LAKLCIYGTVLNSADTVERAIRSVFRPDADIVITDGGSMDNTYEKLLEISKDYNLRVYRASGTGRGLGRQIALTKCPEGSYVTPFDLDDEYNIYWHRSLDWGMAIGGPKPLNSLYYREYLLSKGGWSDLNYPEDYELGARVSFDNYFPLIMRTRIRDLKFNNLAEYELKRYSRGFIGSLKRTLRYEIDIIRGYGYTLRDYLQEPAFKKRLYLRPFAVLVYSIASLEGIYRYDRRFNNHDLVYYNSLLKIRDPVKELSVDKRYAAMIIPISTAMQIGVDWAAERLKLAGLRPYLCERIRGMALVGMRDLSAIDTINKNVYIKLTSCKPLDEI